MKGFKWLYHFLASKGLAIWLFGTVCVLSVPGTFMEEKDIYSGPVFLSVLILIGLNLLFCSLKRIKALPKSVLVLHIGVIVTLAGGMISASGFVATVNVYEGTPVDMFYRWDLKKDTALGFALTVKKINKEYYPIPVKVGVLRDNEKHGLYVLRTGETFNIDNYDVRADSLNLEEQSLVLSVFNQGHFIGSSDTSGKSSLPSGFPYKFVLVAFQNPSIKKMWVNLALSGDSGVIAEGPSEVNSPFKWQGLSFYHTSTSRDQYGFPYAGIQIVSDPGKPYVYAGFIIMGLGAVMYFARKIYGHK